MPLSDIVGSDRRHQIHSLHHPVDTEDALICVGGKGIIIRDADGKEYIDGLSGLWNVNVGHGRAELADAAAEQMRTLAYSSGYAGSTTIPSVQLAERLIALIPDMGGVYFTSGGSEANEAALKTARYYWKVLGKTDKIKIISRIHAYHGTTLQAMSATGIAGYWKMFEPRVPGFIHIQTCYPYRCHSAKTGETPADVAVREFEEAILREGPDTVAAFIGEPIHGAGGIIYPTDDYWPRMREICTRYDVLFVADEIITGFGRTGRWFGLDHWNVRPDILTFAKGVTSGYLPLGGMIVSREIKNALDSAEPSNRWMHGFTYSGHPTCCAVALKNIEIIEREGLIANSAAMGSILLSELANAFGEHPNTGDIRGGKGLLAAIEFVEDRKSKKNFSAEKDFSGRLRKEMLRRGVVTRTRPAAGQHPSSGDELFFAPPLVIDEREIRRMVAVAKESVTAVLSS